MSPSELVLTVDVEPDWGVSGGKSVEQALPRLLDLLARFEGRATFFVVADLADRYAPLLAEVGKAHEIASHGLTHQCLHQLGEKEIATELTASKERLEGLGCEAKGFRAPWLRTPDGWPRQLMQAGYEYDSSVGRCYPSFHNVSSKRWRVERCDNMVSLPTTTLRDGLTPFSLTYLRLLAPLSAWMVPRNAHIFYLHLHELMPPDMARMLPLSRRYVLRRNVGGPAWRILERLLESRRGAIMSCSDFLARQGGDA